ncbi:hypothetical protein E2562_025918 [Oryza meyeriana var. granulata]|uniref:Uncharacterized protein n=1 Tax=Oryza meyeriana var. granulata TaxID=110450 RepID=A0A6G1CH68_9ORYZ|nr:hypothetical protein E2562_025918 [Oryza meyeriana var. granulata]
MEEEDGTPASVERGRGRVTAPAMLQRRQQLWMPETAAASPMEGEGRAEEEQVLAVASGEGRRQQRVGVQLAGIAFVVALNVAVMSIMCLAGKVDVLLWLSME